MKFQDKLQALRKQKGISQEKLAEAIGISRQAIAKWEVGQSCPDIDNLLALGDYFKTSIDRLVRDSADETCAFDGMKPLNYVGEEIIDVLRRAKKACYAANGAHAASSRPGSHDLHYSENEFLYIDTYLGGEKFAGEEALWRNDAPVWSMNYAGRLLAEGFSGDFLKECLLLVPKEYPYRGPLVHQNGDYRYHCIVNGEFEWFNGFEEIFCNDIKVYECFFHGGCIR